MTAHRDTRPSLPCRYCGEPVFEQYDPEVDQPYFPYSGDYRGNVPTTGAHLFSCMDENRSGEWIVRLTQTAVTPARVTEHRYTTQRRAREVAADYRQWNPRNRPCGEHLDIVVTRQPVPVA